MELILSETTRVSLIPDFADLLPYYPPILMFVTEERSSNPTRCEPFVTGLNQETKTLIIRLHDSIQ
jgi:hypothetical protein